MIKICALSLLLAMIQTKHFLLKTEDLAGGIEEAGEDYQNYHEYQDYNEIGIQSIHFSKKNTKHVQNM